LPRDDSLSLTLYAKAGAAGYPDYPGTPTGFYFVEQDVATKDWLWYDPAGRPFAPTAIDKIQMNDFAHASDVCRISGTRSSLRTESFCSTANP